MSKAKEILRAWKKIYSNWKYSLAMIIIAIIFYVINAIIQHQVYETLIDFYKTNGFISTLSLLSKLTIGLKDTMYLSSFISLILTGLLLGMLFTLVFYKTRAIADHGMNKKSGLIASIGIFLGVAAPGCAACGVGLLALFGISAAVLGSLPLMGLEVSILAIVILVFSIIYISKGLLECKTCKIQLNQLNSLNS